MVTEDEHPRPDTTLEALQKLKPIVKPDGTVTAGNASGVNDGACALIVASEEAVGRFGLTPKARVVRAAAAGVAPRVMGMGPVPASRKALAMAGLTIGAMEVIELNEAFAAQGLAVLRELGVARRCCACECQWRSDCARASVRREWCAVGDPCGLSIGARCRALCIVHYVYWRRARYCNDSRKGLVNQ